MRDGFAAFWARVLVVTGMGFVVLGILFAAVALVVDMPWGKLTGQAVLERSLAAAVLLLSGVVAGAPFVVLGEMMLVFLDQRRLMVRQRRLLARIHRRLGREEPGGQGPSMADRLTPRR